MDNGYALFHHVHIPRFNMLMGYAQVSSSGTYTKQNGAEKVAYGIMLDVRARICINSAYVLARAVTISVRYSCIRLQGHMTNSLSSSVKRRTEIPVIEYPTQQRVLMPLLALSFALHYLGSEVRTDYQRYTESQDMSLLPDLHATSAGLKALLTYRVGGRDDTIIFANLNIPHPLDYLIDIPIFLFFFTITFNTLFFPWCLGIRRY